MGKAPLQTVEVAFNQNREQNNGNIVIVKATYEVTSEKMVFVEKRQGVGRKEIRREVNPYTDYEFLEENLKNGVDKVFEAVQKFV